MEIIDDCGWPKRERPVNHEPDARGRVYEALLTGVEGLGIGIAVARADGEIVYANRTACELLERLGWSMSDQNLRCRNSHRQAEWSTALREVCSLGRRRLVQLGDPGDPFVALSPVAGVQSHALLTCGRVELCGALELQLFATRCRLTHAEGLVLQKLALGLTAQQIADLHGTAPSTVNTQIAVLRQKTGTTSIRALLTLVSRLPALIPTLSKASRGPAPTAPMSREAFLPPRSGEVALLAA